MNDEPLSDSKADLHIEESGWLPKPPKRPTADTVITACFVVIAVFTVVGVVASANLGLVTACVTVSLCAWVIAFFVWLLTGAEGAPWQ